MAATALLGHAGGTGWDEVVLVLIPLAGLALLLWFANQRASALDASERIQTDDDAPGPGVNPSEPFGRPGPGGSA